MPIETPNLEYRTASQLAAAAIGRVSDGITPEILDEQIESRRELKALIASNSLPEPICPEATNANPSASHTVVIEALAWMLSLQAYRINQVPFAVFIAFANLFGVERRAASAATGFVRFTVAPPLNTAVVIPLGTEISTESGEYVFETTVATTIPYGTSTMLVAVRRTVTGHALLQPLQLTKLISPIAYVTAVTNPTAIDSGADLESVKSTLERVKLYQRRGERIVSTQDMEDAVRDEALLGNGIARVFPFIVDGDFSGNRVAGHATVVAMTRTGDIVDSAARQQIAKIFDQAVGNQFYYLADPQFVEFDIAASVRLNGGALESAVVAAIEAGLRTLYSASREKFGRGIYRTEIVAVIEDTPGVDRVEVQPGGDSLAQPTSNTELAPHQLAKLVDVTITVV